MYVTANSLCIVKLIGASLQLGLLRRLINFCRAQISTPSHPDPVENDMMIRKIAVLSAQAVFKDVIPGYRIRALTDKEKAEKVSQMVQRTRDFEQGLVNVYQSYLQILEAEVKGALTSMAMLIRARKSLRPCSQKRLIRRSFALHLSVAN